MYGIQDASHIWQPDYVNLICVVHGDDFVCLSADDRLKHIDSLLKSKYTAKDMGTLGFEDSDVKSFPLLNRVFRVGVGQTGQHWDVEPRRSTHHKR